MDGRTDGQMDGQTHYHSPLQITLGDKNTIILRKTFIKDTLICGVPSLREKNN